MIGNIKRVVWLVLAAVGLLIGLVVVKGCFPPRPAAPDVVQVAAQKAATAIVTVKAADQVLVQTKTTIARVDQQLAHIATLKLQLAPDTVVVPRGAVGADTVVFRASPLRDSIIAQQDTVIIELKATTDSLTHALTVTRDVLTHDTTVVIPAVSQKTPLFANLFTHLTPDLTLGYGASYHAGTFTFGPQITVGYTVARILTVGYGAQLTFPGNTVHVVLAPQLTLGLHVRF